MTEKFAAFLKSQHRSLASLIAAVLVFNGLLAVSRTIDPSQKDLAGSNGLLTEQLPEGGTEVVTLPSGKKVVVDADGNIIETISTPGGGSKVKNDTKRKVDEVVKQAIQGVTDDEILVAYYWKGERTMTSPFVNGSGAEGQNLDESLAFERYIEYINKHADGGATIMGHQIDLHGRKLKGVVLDAGNGGASYAQTAERIATEVKPFIAISSHGSLSAYICPRMAEAGIFNIATYDLGDVSGTLSQRTDGYCLPSGIPWERQVDLSIGYLQQHKKTGYGINEEERVYGVVYATYPGLKDSAPLMIEKMKAAGIPIAADYRLPPDLANAGTKARNAVLAMENVGVNTIIMPDAGAPMTFTQAAEANNYRPDYFIWPCSGQDQSGMVRLFNPVQWSNARGLTCYDREFNPDLVNNDKASQTEWWKQYQEMAPGKTPPAPSPNVYASLAQVVIGVTNAGPDLTAESFSAGLDAFDPYRYDSIDGVTKDRTNMLLSIDSSDRAWIGDVGELYWSNTARESGGTAGTYVYVGDRRFSKPSQF